MLLQRGRFIVKNEKELENAIPDNDGIKKVLDLDYMGKIEFEGNTIPILRMLIEYNREKYKYYPVNIFNGNGSQMMFFGDFNQNDSNDTLLKIANSVIDRNYSLYEHIKRPNEEYTNDFWWSIENNYMIFFGKEKISLINYFIDSCYTRDGGKEEIGSKLIKAKVKID